MVEPHALVESDGRLRLNGLYYINKQIIPALERVLSLVGGWVGGWVGAAGLGHSSARASISQLGALIICLQVRSTHEQNACATAAPVRRCDSPELLSPPPVEGLLRCSAHAACGGCAALAHAPIGGAS